MFKPSVLVLENDLAVRKGLIEMLGQAGFCSNHIHEAEDADEATAMFKEDYGYDLIIVDLDLDKEKNGWDFLNSICSYRVFNIVIRSAYYGDDDTVVKSNKKNHALWNDRILAISKDSPEKCQIAEYKTLHTNISELYPNPNELVFDEKENSFLKQAPWIGLTNDSILITGESGSGKESLARTFAKWSPQYGRNEPVVVNCAGITPSLMHSELFGHARNAFNNAEHRMGVLMSASGYEPGNGTTRGASFNNWISNLKEPPSPNHYEVRNNDSTRTLILDEVAELSLETQAALLRVLDNYPIKPVGYDGNGFLPNIRVISMTNDTPKLSDPDKFRKDLLYRISSWSVEVPPIGQRPKTMQAIIYKILNDLTFEGPNGIKFKPDYSIEDECMEFIIKYFQDKKDSGGIRALKAWVTRMCTFANMENTTVISMGIAKKAESNHIDRVIINKTVAPPTEPWTFDKFYKTDSNASMDSLKWKLFKYQFDCLDNGKRIDKAVAQEYLGIKSVSQLDALLRKDIVPMINKYKSESRIGLIEKINLYVLDPE